ncbi:MAG: hypothetical protein HYZ00_09810 [Candidatus Hydrogenedentes bacterium]|nr:hypothetical protein [Candidatus Hydrogenedentota bacterium]
MAKIYKKGDASARQVDRFGREQLEEFPARSSVEFSLPPPLAPQEVQGREVNHEELRQTLLAELRAETQSKVEQAFKEGHRRGLDAGRKEFLESTAHAAEALEAAAQAIREARETFLASLESQVIELVALICQRVLQREVRTDPELVQTTVRRALGKISDQQRLRVRVHPADRDALRRHRLTLLEDFKGIEELEIEADESVTPGGCVVESGFLHVDARIESVLANVLEALSE